MSDRAPDELIFQQLGAAVTLCWVRLPLGVREQILNQTGDTVGFAPVSRENVVKLLLRHTRAQWLHCDPARRKAPPGPRSGNCEALPRGHALRSVGEVIPLAPDQPDGQDCNPGNSCST